MDLPGRLTPASALPSRPGVGAAGQCYPLAPLHGADPTPRPTPARALEFIIRHTDKKFRDILIWNCHVDFSVRS